MRAIILALQWFVGKRMIKNGFRYNNPDENALSCGSYGEGHCVVVLVFFEAVFEMFQQGVAQFL